MPFALALGANLGDAEAALRRGVAGLARQLGRLSVASVYRTAALRRDGSVDPDQPAYWNTVVVGRVAVADPIASARWLVGTGKDLEARAGRRFDVDGPSAQDAPRPLDVDLLLLGGHVLSLDAEIDAADGGPPTGEPSWPGPITVPHPRLRSRRFVLAPLAEVAPDLVVPPDGTTVAALLAAGDWRGQTIERLAVGSPFGGETV